MNIGITLLLLPRGVSLHPLFGQLADGFPSVGPAPISLSWKDLDSFYFFCSAVYHMSSFPIFSCQYIPRIVSRRLCRKKNSYCSAWKTNYQMFHLWRSRRNEITCTKIHVKNTSCEVVARAIFICQVQLLNWTQTSPAYELNLLSSAVMAEIGGNNAITFWFTILLKKLQFPQIWLAHSTLSFSFTWQQNHLSECVIGQLYKPIAIWVPGFLTNQQQENSYHGHQQPIATSEKLWQKRVF